MSTKGCVEFFLFCLDLELFAKIKEDLVLLKLLIRKVCRISAKKLNSMVVGACQSFQYFRQKNWFLGDNKLCLNLGIGF